MRVKSSSSVRIISLDVESIIRKLKFAARELKKSNSNVLDVFLFGSLAKGETVPGSDADLLIVLKKSKKRIIDRVTDFMDSFSGMGMGIDIFPYTVEEINAFKKEENSLIKEAVSHGINLCKPKYEK